MSADDADTEELLRRAGAGDEQARGALLERHRPRLRRMIALRLDRRLAARIDPSDVLQESLAEADRKLSDYLDRQTVPFYPWLRQLAYERLIQLYRRHVQAGKRSVSREVPGGLPLPGESVLELVARLIDRGSSPSARLRRQEEQRRVQAALELLPERDREVLVLRHLEQLSPREIAAVLGLSEGAVKVRHLRAVERLRALLAGGEGGNES
jgi:RNA polymerase sigma-70 factor (ECF subfamily)